MMKVGVSSYSYSRLLRGGEMTLLQAIAKTAEIGFDAIEFSGINHPEGETPASYAPTVRKACDDAGLPIASYTVGADFLNGSGGDLKAEIERVKAEVDIAAVLGAPTMRHDATRGFAAGHRGPRGFGDAIPRLAEGIRAVTEYAQGLGVKTTVENHGYFCQDSVRVEALINAVGHANFGALIDIGNFMCADEDPAQAVGVMAPYCFHLHAKDFHWKSGMGVDPGAGWFRTRAKNYLRGAIIGHGEAPVLQCLKIMKDAGYDGICSIEFEGIEDVIKGIEMGYANLRRFIQMVEG